MAGWNLARLTPPAAPPRLSESVYPSSSDERSLAIVDDDKLGRIRPCGVVVRMNLGTRDRAMLRRCEVGRADEAIGTDWTYFDESG